MVVDLSVWDHSHVTSSPFRGTILATVGAIILVAMFLHGVGEAQAQANVPVCSNTPATGERIECKEDATSTEDIDIDTSNLTINTTMDDHDGIELLHRGSGDIDVNSQSDSITTTGTTASGIVVYHQGATGDITVRVTSPTISTGAQGSSGIHASSTSIGKLDVDIRGGSITTTGAGSDGVFVWHAYEGTDQAGPTTLDINGNAEITTSGDDSRGVSIGRNSDGGGENILNLEDVTIGTMGRQSYGVQAKQGSDPDFTVVGDVEVNMLGGVSITTGGETAHGVFVEREGRNTVVEGDVVVTARGRNTVITKGVGAHGIFGNHTGTGDIDLDVRNATIVTESTELGSYGDTFAVGILGQHSSGSGNIDIDLQGGSIETRGVYSYGVYGTLEDAAYGGEVSIRTGDGHTITTTGANGDGIVAYNYGTLDTASISVEVGGSITTTGAGAQGVRVGSLSSSGAPERVAPIHIDDGTDKDKDKGFVYGHRRQTVTVNGRVIGNAAGVYLAGGGRVVIGPQGSVGAKSGIAILATGVVPEDATDPNNVIPAIQPKLRVDLNLRGRRVAQAIGHNWIMNDGGETTIAVNDIVLHDGADGVVEDAVAANGAWNVTMREAGVMVDRSTDPWPISAPAANVFADRDFSVQDFMQAIAGRAQVARAQCSDAALTTQAPITNEEAASSTTDLSVNADGVKISATGAAESGINQLHRGEGDITVNVSNSCVETTGAGGSVHEASGILASSKSDTDPKTNVGDVKIDVRDSTITTQGRRAKGIVGAHTHTGDVDIDVENTAITTEGEYAYGVHGSRNGTGDVTIGVENSTLTVKGERSRGIYGFHSGVGDVNLNVNNTTINVLGRLGYGVYGQQHRLGTGSVNIMLNNVDLMSKNVSVFGYTDGLGDTIIDVQNSAITAESIAIYGYHVGGGGDSEVGLIDIDVRDTIITTTTDDDKAIYAYHGVPPVVGDTEVDIENTIITTFGADADGIFGRHTSGMGAFDINVLNGSVIHAIGDGSSGVRVGSLNNAGEVIDAGGIGDDGYRLHNILIDGQVTGNLAGVYLAGGGRVVIGPQGSVGAHSGIAILATGDTPGANPGDPVIKPKLHVNMNLGGRRVAQVIGNDWIVNDGGETTIAVNNVTLHDGKRGVTGRTAPNGAWNVTMREEGVNVTDYTTDPANWVVSELATGVAADRDFSAQDFNARRKPPPPPPPTSCPDGQVGTPPNCMAPPPTSCPDGQVGTPPNCTEPEPERPMFMEEYAPRAAVYEALPDFLLRLTGPGPARNCRSAPDEPAWVRFAGGQGSYEADRSTTGATYDLERFETEGGLSAAFTDRVKGWVSVRHVWGAAGIGSPTGGGQIDVRGLGSTVGGAWQGANDLYAVGCFSYMAYNVDFASHQQGLLKAGTNGHVYTLDFEAGRRFALTGQVDVTPRVWVVGSRVAVNSFTDAVDARVSFADADRVSGGLGLMADTTRLWGEGEFTLQGSVDYARIVKGAQTRVEVSGERLRAIATENSLLFGLNGVYRQGRFSIGGEVAARQELGSDDNEYASFLNVGMQF